MNVCGFAILIMLKELTSKSLKYYALLFHFTLNTALCFISLKIFSLEFLLSFVIAIIFFLLIIFLYRHIMLYRLCTPRVILKKSRFIRKFTIKSHYRESLRRKFHILYWMNEKMKKEFSFFSYFSMRFKFFSSYSRQNE